MDSTLPSFISRQVLDASYFFLNLKPLAREPFAVCCGGWEKCATNYRLERENFSYLGVEYVLAGKGQVSVEGQVFSLRPGSIFGYGPNTKICIESLGQQPLSKYFVDLQGSQATSLFESSPLGKKSVVDFAGSRWIEETFRQLILFGGNGGEKARRSCALLAEHLLLQLEEREQAGGEGDSTAFRSYRRCRELLETEFLVIASVAELAERMRLDQAYVSRLFNRFDDETPYKKLVRLKMSHAARLLLAEHSCVAEVGERVGFSEAAHFSRVFKNTYGVSPAHFPKTFRRGE